MRKSKSQGSSFYSTKSTPATGRRKTAIPLLSFEFDENKVFVPVKLFYHDFISKKPCKDINLNGWKVHQEIFDLLGSSQFDHLYSLSLNHVTGLTIECLRLLRGHRGLRRLSLVGMKVPIDREVDEIIASCRSLVYLNLGECSFTEQGNLGVMTQCNGNIRTLILSKSTGISNYVLNNLAQFLERFRMLRILDISYCLDFTDEGLLIVMQAGGSILKELYIHHCRQLGTLSLASVRGKMSALQVLEMSHLLIGKTAYEWISEGCRTALMTLDLSKCIELEDEGLGKIGRYCSHLQSLSLAHCAAITDTGIVAFFEKFQGALHSLDLHGCVACTDQTLQAVIHHKATMTSLQSLKLNGLSQITATILADFWKQIAPVLQVFEMCSELKTVSGHRRSMMPHFSDTVLLVNHKKTSSTIATSHTMKETDITTTTPTTTTTTTLPALQHSQTQKILPSLVSTSTSSTSSSSSSSATATAAPAITMTITTKSKHVISERPIRSLKIIGACQVSDIGMALFIQQSAATLQYLDVSDYYWYTIL
jgi:hypothetical protein